LCLVLGGGPVYLIDMFSKRLKGDSKSSNSGMLEKMEMEYSNKEVMKKILIHLDLRDRRNLDPFLRKPAKYCSPLELTQSHGSVMFRSCRWDFLSFVITSIELNS
jgi:hypothetical protein